MVSGFVGLVLMVLAVCIVVFGFAAIAFPARTTRAFVAGTFAITASVLLIIGVWVYWIVKGGS